MARLREFLARAQQQLQLSAQSLTVCLVSDAEIARWNSGYRNKHGPTDVLSFPARLRSKRRGSRTDRARGKTGTGDPAGAAADATYLGDIAIAPAVARRNARRFGRKFEDELRILILHGMLHLMGYDHETDSGQMDRRERSLRRKLGLA